MLSFPLNGELPLTIHICSSKSKEALNWMICGPRFSQLLTIIIVMTQRHTNNYQSPFFIIFIFLKTVGAWFFLICSGLTLHLFAYFNIYRWLHNFIKCMHSCAAFIPLNLTYIGRQQVMIAIVLEVNVHHAFSETCKSMYANAIGEFQEKWVNQILTISLTFWWHKILIIVENRTWNYNKNSQFCHFCLIFRYCYPEC